VIYSHAHGKALTHFFITERLSSLPAAGNYKVDPLLGPKGSITFGYGSGGEAPLVFRLAEGRKVEFGFFKLFLSTESVDFSDVEQPSPFTESGTPRSIGKVDTSSWKISTWDSIVVTVVLRRK
jgi:hypothetical protein